MTRWLQWVGGCTLIIECRFALFTYCLAAKDSSLKLKLFVGLLGVVLNVELVLDGDVFGLDMVELDSDEICSICGVGGTVRVDCANCELKKIKY